MLFRSEDGPAHITYTFTRSGDATNPLTVAFTVTGSASFDSDYTQTGASSFTATAGSITFAAGSSTASITIDPLDDLSVEHNESIVLTLLPDSAYAIGTADPVAAIISNDDTATVAISDASISEGNAGTTTADRKSTRLNSSHSSVSRMPSSA